MSSLFSRKIPEKKGVKNSAIILFEKPKSNKYDFVVFSLVENISETDFFFNIVFSFRILNLSETVPILANSVENNKDKSRKGSPIMFCFPFLNIEAPGKNFCNCKASKLRYFCAAGYAVSNT